MTSVCHDFELPPERTPLLRNVYLHPGQIFTSDVPALVTTILGSCIAVCLWDPQAKVAGINHFLLPTNPCPGTDDLRYGNTAIDRLVAEVVSAGASPLRLVAKLAGGASVLNRLGGERKTIGEQNVAVAKQILRKHSIPVGAEQVGGQHGRKLLFHTGNGCAFSKEIQR